MSGHAYDHPPRVKRSGGTGTYDDISHRIHEVFQVRNMVMHLKGLGITWEECNQIVSPFGLDSEWCTNFRYYDADDNPRPWTVIMWLRGDNHYGTGFPYYASSNEHLTIGGKYYDGETGAGGVAPYSSLTGGSYGFRLGGTINQPYCTTQAQGNFPYYNYHTPPHPVVGGDFYSLSTTPEKQTFLNWDTVLARFRPQGGVLGSPPRPGNHPQYSVGHVALDPQEKQVGDHPNYPGSRAFGDYHAANYFLAGGQEEYSAVGGSPGNAVALGGGDIKYPEDDPPPSGAAERDYIGINGVKTATETSQYRRWTYTDTRSGKRHPENWGPPTEISGYRKVFGGTLPHHEGSFRPDSETRLGYMTPVRYHKISATLWQYQTHCPVGPCLMFRRALDDDEIAEITTSPWRLVRQYYSDISFFISPLTGEDFGPRKWHWDVNYHKAQPGTIELGHPLYVADPPDPTFNGLYQLENTSQPQGMVPWIDYSSQAIRGKVKSYYFIATPPPVSIPASGAATVAGSGAITAAMSRLAAMTASIPGVSAVAAMVLKLGTSAFIFSAPARPRTFTAPERPRTFTAPGERKQ